MTVSIQRCCDPPASDSLEFRWKLPAYSVLWELGAATDRVAHMEDLALVRIKLELALTGYKTPLHQPHPAQDRHIRHSGHQSVLNDVRGVLHSAWLAQHLSFHILRALPPFLSLLFSNLYSLHIYYLLSNKAALPLRPYLSRHLCLYTVAGILNDA